jgi:tetratricopeptide (TPR) repeat protein
MLSRHPALFFIALCAVAAFTERGTAAESASTDDSAPVAAEQAKAGETRPNEAVVPYERGIAYAKAGRHAEAIASYNKALELDPKYAEAYYERANQYVRLGDYLKAIGDCDKAIDLRPKLAEPRFLRGVAYAYLGRARDAREDFQRAIKLKPALEANVAALSARFPLAAPTTVSEDLAKNIQQAVKELDYPGAAAHDFVELVGRWGLGAMRQRIRQAKEDCQAGKISKTQVAEVEQGVVKDLCQRILKEVAYNVSAFSLNNVVQNHQANCVGYTQLVYVLGNCLGLTVRAATVAEMATGLPPFSGAHIACLVDLTDGQTMMVDLGVSAETASKPFVSKPFLFSEAFSEAGGWWTLKTKDNPLGVHRKLQLTDRNGLISIGYTNQGALYHAAGQHSQAIASYTKGIEIAPQHATAYYDRGNAYGELGQYAEAIADFTKAIEISPDYVEAYYNRGTVREVMGQHGQAVSDCTKAIALNPGYAEAYVNRGNAYLALGRQADAIADYNKAIELNLTTAYLHRGIAYLNDGKLPQAIADFSKAMEVKPNDDKAYFNRATAYAKAGKPHEAVSDLRKAIELNPAIKTWATKVSDQYQLGL